MAVWLCLSATQLDWDAEFIDCWNAPLSFFSNWLYSESLFDLSFSVDLLVLELVFKLCLSVSCFWMNSVLSCFILLECLFFGVRWYPLSFLLFVFVDEKLFSFSPNGVCGVVKTTVEARIDIVTGAWGKYRN